MLRNSSILLFSIGLLIVFQSSAFARSIDNNKQTEQNEAEQQEMIQPIEPVVQKTDLKHNEFYNSQLKYPRVKQALENRNEEIDTILSKADLTRDDFQMLMVVYKDPGVIELFGKSKSADTYRSLKSFPICYYSGWLGPKRQQGDLQTPEGFYYINRYSAKSSFHLSLKISYPNKSDRIRETSSDAGGDILIHGDCVSIGCMAMTDSYIETIYMLAVYSAANGQKDIPVYIFPFEMNQNTLDFYLSIDRYAKQHDFWYNLKEGYDLFFRNHKALNYSIDKKTGDYIFKH